ncbi:recombinase family protein [Cutibacterium granulosum]|uniref:recombinase family protein n=1 Tax=Cutibacterium granulosum TaxID=33011 RepID=UPI0027B9F34A|nr:recombinase family protein [Cutibacterium granulosum]
MTVAAAYLRVSKADETDDESLTLETQRRRIKALCKARGWLYGPEYIDEGVSATKRRDEKTRWAELLADVGRGKFDVIVARDLDRLLRTLQDLVKLIDLKARVATVDGEIDLTTADGELRATMLAAVARFEIRRKSERSIGANETRRRKGLPIIRVKILGYDDDGITQIDDEAAAVEKAFLDYLSGVGLAQVCRDLNAGGFTSSRGLPWSNNNIRSLLMNARYKGVITKWEPDAQKRKASGALTDEVYPGIWDPIVTADVFDAVQAKLRDPARRRNWGTEPRYLMSGLLRCGKCGGKMYTSFYCAPDRTLKSGKVVKTAPKRIYKCLTHNHLSRVAEPIDELVERIVLARLQEPDAADLFSPQQDDGMKRDELRAERLALQTRYDSLAGLVTDGLLPADQVRQEAPRLVGRIKEIDGLLAPGPESVGQQLAEAPDIEEAWAELDMAHRRIVVGEILTLTLLPGGRPKKLEKLPRTVADPDLKIEMLG